MNIEKADVIPQEELEADYVVEVRCAGGCGRLLGDVSAGSVDPSKQDIICQKCGQLLRTGEWHGIKGRPSIKIAVYRCHSCNVIYEKVFEGVGRRCKKCHTHRYVFVATNANPPVMTQSRGAA